MPKHTRYFFAGLLLGIPSIAEAQAQYTPEPATPGSSVFIYIIVIGIVGLLLFYLYRLFSRRAEDTPHRQLETTQPKPQPAQRPIRFPTASTYVPGSIFISYRRDDSADITGRIYDRLIQHFSREIVFKDVDSIPLGIDFRQHLEGALSQCRVLLAIVGDQWTGREVAEGKRRIDDLRDH